MKKKDQETKHSSEYRNKVVVVTGASAGVGRAVVREFAKNGASIGLLARGKEGLEAAAREVEELGGKSRAIFVDVADFEKLEAAADRIEKEFGTVDVWINNAMTSVFSPLLEVKPEEFKRVTEVTYLGQVYGTMIALKKMIPRDSGCIIMVGSALGYRGIPLQSAYCGAKHGVQGFFESARAELLHDKSNVKLNMVQLPALNTPQFEMVKSRLPKKARPMGTVYQPEVAAKAIYDTAKGNRRERIVGYSTAQTILGNKFIPGFMDRYLAKTGYEGQQTEEDENPDRENNLWQPVAGDHGAHGEFDNQSWRQSPFYRAAKSRWTLTVLTVVGLGIGSWLSSLYHNR